jgi:exopolysaccharide biosynthesis operon protein EpsL
MYSRQRLAASARLSRATFDHFRQLDYNGEDAQATWYWQVGNHLEGKAGAIYQQVLAPYTDFASNERNLRQERKLFVDGTWRFHPGWSARAATSTDKFTYDLASQRYNDRTEDVFELEGGYLPRSGSTVGVVVRRLRGGYPHLRPLGGVLVNEDFTQDELKLHVNWLASGVTTVQLLAGWVQRDQPGFAGKTDGVNGRLSAVYAPGGKISCNAALWREFGPIDSTFVNYTLNKGASIGARWDASAKVKVDASALYERRDYNPTSPFPGSGDLEDSIRSASLRAVWSLRPALQLAAGYAHESRSGSQALGTASFSSNSVSFNASAQF